MKLKICFGTLFLVQKFDATENISVYMDIFRILGTVFHRLSE